MILNYIKTLYKFTIMDNNTIKENLFIYNTADIIIKDSRYPYNVIYQNKYSDYDNYNYIYSYFDTIFIIELMLFVSNGMQNKTRNVFVL